MRVASAEANGDLGMGALGAEGGVFPICKYYKSMNTWMERMITGVLY